MNRYRVSAAFGANTATASINAETDEQAVELFLEAEACLGFKLEHVKGGLDGVSVIVLERPPKVARRRIIQALVRRLHRREGGRRYGGGVDIGDHVHVIRVPSSEAHARTCEAWHYVELREVGEHEIEASCERADDECDRQAVAATAHVAVVGVDRDDLAGGAVGDGATNDGTVAFDDP